MDKENRSYSYLACEAMITSVFKQEKMNVLDNKINILKENIPKQVLMKKPTGSGYNAVKFLRM